MPNHLFPLPSEGANPASPQESVTGSLKTFTEQDNAESSQDPPPAPICASRPTTILRFQQVPKHVVKARPVRRCATLQNVTIWVPQEADSEMEMSLQEVYWVGRALRTENCPLQERKKVRAEGKLGCPAIA